MDRYLSRFNTARSCKMRSVARRVCFSSNVETLPRRLVAKMQPDSPPIPESCRSFNRYATMRRERTLTWHGFVELSCLRSLSLSFSPSASLNLIIFCKQRFQELLNLNRRPFLKFARLSAEHKSCSDGPDNCPLRRRFIGLLTTLREPASTGSSSSRFSCEAYLKSIKRPSSGTSGMIKRRNETHYMHRERERARMRLQPRRLSTATAANFVAPIAFPLYLPFTLRAAFFITTALKLPCVTSAGPDDSLSTCSLKSCLNCQYSSEPAGRAKIALWQRGVASRRKAEVTAKRGRIPRDFPIGNVISVSKTENRVSDLRKNYVNGRIVRGIAYGMHK
ncbi:hypothetical protein PUN28_010978 [Cardiocondyla obscurior]|uniref:Ribosomal protein S14 n=1 Tax=Cardiocondyla obscurior TaxID=286306 RepID=A0AAW2FN34_9HYME